MQAKTTTIRNPVEIPEDIICPITQQIMIDPVMLVESGHTYEREAILKHLRTKQTDPLTNQTIISPAIAPNHTVKKLIGSFLEKQRPLHPDIYHEMYLPQSWIQDVLTAMEKADIQGFNDTLKKDSRLLTQPLKADKTLFTLACESAPFGILERVIAQLGDQIRQLETVKPDNGLSTFLTVSRRLGVQGAACMAKAMDWKQNDFQALLVSSVEENDSGMVDIALSLGAVGTPELLRHAYLKNKIDVLKRLVLAGVATEDLLLKAVENHQEELMAFLLTDAKSFMNPNVMNKQGQSPWLLAVYKNQLQTVLRLLTLPSLDITQTDRKGNTALHYAAMQGNQDIVKGLMKRGLSIKTQNKDHKTVLQLASENDHHELAKWMEERHRYLKVKPFLKPLKTRLKAQEVWLKAQEAEINQLRDALKTVKSTASPQPATTIPTRSDSQAPLSSSTDFPISTSASVSPLNNRFSAVFPSSPPSSASSSFPQNQAILRSVQQVEMASKAAQNKINPEELNALLRWGVEGHLEEVEKLLKKNPSLGLGTGTVTDLSDRTFKNITVLQYAAWALDAEMCELIVPYLGAQNASIQLKALANEPECYGAHGASYDYTSLVTKTQTYVDNYNSWNSQKCNQYWQKEVGEEQRKCPAWLIYAWSEEGADVAWAKKDPNRQIKREYEKHRLDWWFTADHNGWVGRTWPGHLRGAKETCIIYIVGVSMRKELVGDLLFHDEYMVSRVGKTRCETLQRLRASVDSQSIQVTLPSMGSPTSPFTSSLAQIVSPLPSTSNVSQSLFPISGFSGVFSSPPPNSLPLKSNPVTLKYSQQVEMASKAVQDKIDQKELAALLKWVTEGDLVEVKKLLEKNPTLALGTGRVTDRSDRIFKNMTVLQYAAWALDAEMCELIIPYLGAHNTSIQLKALANESVSYSPHGASYDFTPLVTKTQTYVNNYASWDNVARSRYWQKEVGGEQRKCPAWLIYAWSEKGADVAWAKKEVNRKITREYDENRLEWWFTENYNSGCGVGSSWAVARGWDYSGVSRCKWHREVFSSDESVMWDMVCVPMLGKSRGETLQRLRASVDNELNQDTLAPAQGLLFPSAWSRETTTTVTTNPTSAKPPAPY